MKVYRVIPNSFVNGTNQKNFGIYCNDFLGAEDIYYKLGYISFVNKVGVANNEWTNDESKHGKYFFLFLEDAIFEALLFMQHHHGLEGNAYNIVVYDVPIDIILDNIRRGLYSVYRTQSFIPMKFFNNPINCNELTQEEKLSTCIDLFKKTITSEEKTGFGEKTFRLYALNLGMSRLETEKYLLNLIEDEEQLKDVIIKSPLFNQLSLNNANLYNNDFNSHIMFPFNEFLKRKNFDTYTGEWNININNYLKDVDVFYEYDMEYLKEIKKEINDLLRADEDEGNIREETREIIRSRLLNIK